MLRLDTGYPDILFSKSWTWITGNSRIPQIRPDEKFSKSLPRILRVPAVRPDPDTGYPEFELAGFWIARYPVLGDIRLDNIR